MKKVLTLVVLVAIASIFTTGAMGQTAKNDPNAIGVYQMMPTESMAQLNGSAKWEGNVSRDVVLTESVEILNRYNSQLDWGFAPVGKDFFVKSVLPKLKTGTLDPATDDPLIGGKSGADRISMNNNPEFTKDDLFWYWDVRSFNHPSETYRVYLYKVICNNPVEYFKKLEEVPLVQVKEVIVHDTVPQYITKVDSVPYTVYKEVGTTATTPVINNYNYNYNTVPGGGYDNGYNFWNSPSNGCFGGGWNVGASWGFGSYQTCNSPWQGGFCGYQQPYYQQPSPYYGGFNDGDVIVYVTVEGNRPWWPIGIGGDDDDDDPDEPDDDDDGGPDEPDDDDDGTGGGDDDDGGPDYPDTDDGKFAGPKMVSAEEFASAQKTEDFGIMTASVEMPNVYSAKSEAKNPTVEGSKPTTGDVAVSEPKPSKGDGVKTDEKPVAVAPNPGAAYSGPSKDPGQNPVAISPNPGASQVKDPVVINPNPGLGNPSKEDVALNNYPSASVSNPEPSKGNGVKTDAVPVAVDPKPGVFDGPSKGSVKEPVAVPRPDANQYKDPVSLSQNEAPIPVNHGANINIQDKGIYSPPPKPANPGYNGQPNKGKVKKPLPPTSGPKPGSPKAKTTKKGG